MLEGLEIAEVDLGQLEFSGRLDSEYYRPNHLLAEQLVLRRSGVPLGSLCDFVIGPFGSAFTVENYTDNQSYRYIRGKDVKPMALAEDDNVYMPKADYDRLSKYALCADDVLVSVVGTIGNAALVEPRHIPAIFSCKSTALRPYNLDSRYLVTYLNCKYGRDLLLRKERGAIQKGLNLDDLKTLLIYVPRPALRDAIANIHETASNTREQAKKYQLDAEEVLLSSLAVDHWQAPESLTYVRNSSEAFVAGRLDAEHFQEANFALRELLTNQKQGFRRIGDLARSLTNGAEIREYRPEGTPYLRVGDIKNLSVDENSVRYVDPVLAEKELQKVSLEAGDVLVSRSGSLAVTAVVEPEWSHALISSHLIRVRIADPDFDPYYVALFLSTLPGKMQIKQWSNGGVQPEINQPSLAQIVVPKIARQTQQEIRDAIFAAREKRQRATQLLEAAKRAVEIAIEQSEAEALAYLHDIAVS